MLFSLILSFSLFLFGFFNLLGIRQENAYNQLIFFGVGLGGFFIARKIGYQFFRANAKLFYWFFIAVLIVTFIVGVEVKGSKRWIDFYFFRFQSSEILKIFFILFLADFLSKVEAHHNSFSTFLMSFLYASIPAAIIFKQPDFGNAVVYMFIYLCMVFFSKLDKKHVLSFMIILIFMIPFGWLVLKDYQRDRFISFLSPHIDQGGDAYNMIQAMITVGSGGFFGRGLGFGTQSKLAFLPENHTDFAYSSLVEQFGFLGGFFVIILYAVFTWYFINKLVRLFSAKTPESQFSFLYTLGLFSYFVFQTFVNIGMNVGLLPIAGITLPFISYGGSSIVAFLIGLAILP